jgi:hypothetical protein
MSTTLAHIVALADRGGLRISAHGYDEIAADNILVGDVIEGLAHAIVVED